MVVIDYWLP